MLYSTVLIDIIPAPYSILKYDQVVHTFCYFVVALLVWQIVRHIVLIQTSFGILAIISVLAATEIGGLNEIIEFLATVCIENVNVGGYEITAIEIVANLIGSLLVVPFFRRLE